MVFVYGTLKRGGRLNSHMSPEHAEFVGDGTLDENHSLYVPEGNNGGWFPMLMEEPTALKCKGEVFLISEQLLSTLDRVEGTPRLYKRKEVEVTLGNGETVNAFTYVYNNQLPQGVVKSDTFNIK